MIIISSTEITNLNEDNLNTANSDFQKKDETNNNITKIINSDNNSNNMKNNILDNKVINLENSDKSNKSDYSLLKPETPKTKNKDNTYIKKKSNFRTNSNNNTYKRDQNIARFSVKSEISEREYPPLEPIYDIELSNYNQNSLNDIFNEKLSSLSVEEYDLSILENENSTVKSSFPLNLGDNQVDNKKRRISEMIDIPPVENVLDKIEEQEEDINKSFNSGDNIEIITENKTPKNNEHSKLKKSLSKFANPNKKNSKTSLSKRNSINNNKKRLTNTISLINEEDQKIHIIDKSEKDNNFVKLNLQDDDYVMQDSNNNSIQESNMCTIYTKTRFDYKNNTKLKNIDNQSEFSSSRQLQSLIIGGNQINNEESQLKEENKENNEKNKENNNNENKDNKDNLEEKPYIDFPIKDYDEITLMEKLIYDRRSYGRYLADHILAEHIVFNIFYLNSLFVPR